MCIYNSLYVHILNLLFLRQSVLNEGSDLSFGKEYRRYAPGRLHLGASPTGLWAELIISTRFRAKTRLHPLDEIICATSSMTKFWSALLRASELARVRCASCPDLDCFPDRSYLDRDPKGLRAQPACSVVCTKQPSLNDDRVQVPISVTSRADFTEIKSALLLSFFMLGVIGDCSGIVCKENRNATSTWSSWY